MTDLFPATVRTERLRFERFRPALLDALDHDDIYHYWGHEDGIEDATAMMTWEPHAHQKETLDVLEGMADGAASGEDGVYAVFPRDELDADPDHVDASVLDADAFAGTAGIHPDWDCRFAGFGMWLRKRYWGRGYSGERADAFVHLAFERLDLDAVSVETYPENERSRRAIEKYVERWGGRFEGTFRHLKATDGPQTVRRYTIARADYDAADVDRAIEVLDA